VAIASIAVCPDEVLVHHYGDAAHFIASTDDRIAVQVAVFHRIAQLRSGKIVTWSPGLAFASVLSAILGCSDPRELGFTTEILDRLLKLSEIYDEFYGVDVRSEAVELAQAVKARVNELWKVRLER
jgi:hypothetical protein